MPDRIDSRFFLIAVLTCGAFGQVPTPPATFGPSNPCYAPVPCRSMRRPSTRSKTPITSPRFEAAVSTEDQAREIDAIANNPAAAEFLRTPYLRSRKAGNFSSRVQRAFFDNGQANYQSRTQEIQRIEAPKLSALEDATMLNPKLFARVQAVYTQRGAMALDAESRRLVEQTC